jgi:hypothetical protein
LEELEELGFLDHRTAQNVYRRFHDTSEDDRGE